MKKIILSTLTAILLPGVILASPPQITPAQQTFADLDQAFVTAYSKVNRKIGQSTFPLLVVNGFEYDLYLADGSVKKFNGLVAPFNELKAVSHIGPALYTLVSPAWLEPKDSNWQQNLRDFQVKVQAALADVNKVDWNNAGWPNNGEKLKSFMHDSLEMVNNFITQVLKKNSATMTDYQTFAQHYMHTMIATMYLADVSNTTSVLTQLKAWKKEMGEKEWDKLYVLVMGSKGRTTSELTVDTSTVGITVKGLMKPEIAATHIIIMPTATTLQDAQASLGAIINAKGLAEATFMTTRAKDATGIYNALKTADIPLARDNVVHIVHQDIQSGHVDLPKLEILEKDQGVYK